MPASGDYRPQRRRRFFGRDHEIDSLLTLFDDEGPEIIELTGVPGIGKSSLIREFAKAARAMDRTVDIFDCRALEPTVTSFEQALEVLWKCGPGSGWRVICLDCYDHFLLLDVWLRNQVEHLLEQGIRLVLVGRSIQCAPWSAPGLRMRSMRLDGLDPEAARQLLADMDRHRCDTILQFTQGHPLALELALALPTDGEGQDLASLPSPELVHRLTRFFMDQVPEPVMRTAIEASATVRRVTRPLLESMLGADHHADLFDDLAALPLIEVRSDGLSLHPTVHESMASWLRTADPARFSTYRQRAWETLQRRGLEIPRGDLWRYTADAIYLIDDPIVRGAFFPTNSQSYSVEPARPDDHEAILEITGLHDGVEGRKTMDAWLAEDPGAFHVVRDRNEALQGYYCLIRPARVSMEAINADPQTRAWHEDLQSSQVATSEDGALYLRRWLSCLWGDVPSPIQAASWLDIKRAYLEGRPKLRRVYLAVSDLTPYVDAALKLGFTPICTDLELPHASAMLDFGPASVDGWLGRLVQQSLGILDSVHLDAERQVLELGARSVPLTPRERDVVGILLASRGSTVSRDRLMREAWEGGYSVGSNVIDVLIRGLRKKLGDRAGLIETVRGAGYRWLD